jgi:hypothetical protein
MTITTTGAASTTHATEKIDCQRLNCGESFEPRKSGGRPKKFCSRACQTYTNEHSEERKAYDQSEGRRASKKASAAARMLTPRGMTLQLLKAARCRVAKNKLPYDLTYEWLLPKVEKGLCEVTDLKFQRGPQTKKRPHPYALSLDQIIAGGGYLQFNTRLVLWGVNNALATYGDEFFGVMCHAFVKKNPNSFLKSLATEGTRLLLVASVAA